MQQGRLGTQLGRARRTVVLAPAVVVHQGHMGIALAIQCIDIAAQAACQPVVGVLLTAGQRQCAVIPWRHGGTLEQLRIGHRRSVKVQRPLRVILRHQAGGVAPQQGIRASLHGKHALVVTKRFARVAGRRRPFRQQHQVIRAAFATRQAGFEQGDRFSRAALRLQLLRRGQGHATANTLLQRVHVSAPGCLRQRAQAVQGQGITVAGL
ncbi:hypothetical protein D3C76_1226960 [compost metagenome]